MTAGRYEAGMLMAEARLVPMHRRRIAVACGLAALTMALASCGEDKKPVAQAPLSVLTQVATFAPDFTSVSLTGEIRARVQSDLSFRVTGRIASRLVDIGDRVTAGQVLATLETTEQTADVASATAGVQAAEATLRQAVGAFERQKSLMTSGYTTQPNFDNANQALSAAQAALVSARATLSTSQEQLNYTSLRTDAAGIITARNAETGQVVEAAQAIFTIARDGARDAVFDIYETLLTKEPADELIAITLLSNPAIKATGRVREIAPAIDAAMGTVRVKITVDKAPPEMGLGAAVTGAGRFRSQEVIKLPRTAIFAEGNKPAVWIVDPQSKAVSLRQVVVDSYRTGELLLREGVKAGDIVVTAGVQLLRPGQIVAPQPAGGQT